ncbi:MAG: hypothetical protein HN348_22595, partial [Proteobacteria bacterium]|nr:hypothetical protein [Pseudomonadota bacterium]
DYYKDADGDNYGHETDSRCLCSATGEYNELDNDDCDDSNSTAKPYTSYQSSYNGNLYQGWDWDCDNTVEEKYSYYQNIYDCSLSLDWSNFVIICYYTSGWETSRPDCGESGNRLTGCDFTLDFWDLVSNGNFDLCEHSSSTNYVISCK